MPEQYKDLYEGYQPNPDNEKSGRRGYQPQPSKEDPGHGQPPSGGSNVNPPKGTAKKE